MKEKGKEEGSRIELESSKTEPFSFDHDIGDPTFQMRNSEKSSNNEVQISRYTCPASLLPLNENRSMYHVDLVEAETNGTENFPFQIFLIIPKNALKLSFENILPTPRDYLIDR